MRVGAGPFGQEAVSVRDTSAFLSCSSRDASAKGGGRQLPSMRTKSLYPGASPRGGADGELRAPHRAGDRNRPLVGGFELGAVRRAGVRGHLRRL